MVYLKLMGAVTQNELQAVGYRCQDLALLHQNQVQIAGSVVILSNALDEVMRLNNLKYKIDYVMSHAQAHVQSSLQNVYTSARKALLEAKLPPGFEVELREAYDSVTTPLAIGELVAERPAVRIIMSLNRLDDPESNDSVIQNVNTFEELLVAVREAWALSWHPTLLGARLREHFPEARLKVALIVQAMDEPVTTTHAYSSLPQDHRKVYLQTYYGFPDLRDKVTKDYYAISKDGLRIMATQTKQQPGALTRSSAKELLLTPLAASTGDKMIDRDLVEIARLVKKAERLLQQPVKAFFVTTNEMHELLWVNRLGFDVIVGDDAEPAMPAAPAENAPANPQSAEQIPEQAIEPVAEPIQAGPIEVVQMEQPVPASDDDFIAIPEPAEPPAQKLAGATAKLLDASLRMVRMVVERKHRSAFGETDITSDLSSLIDRLNEASVFSRPVDGALLLQAEEAVKSGTNISEEECAKAIDEAAFLMTYA